MTDPRQDPHAIAVGFDVTAMSAVQMEKAGVRVTARVLGDGGQAWMTHANYSRVNPGHDEKTRRYARLATYLHFERQYLMVQCPFCGRGEGRPCELGPSRTSTAPRLGYAHRERRKAATEAGKVSLRGLMLEQTFPCGGTLRKTEQAGHVMMVQCDVCGQELGVAPPRAGERLPPGRDDIPL